MFVCQCVMILQVDCRLLLLLILLSSLSRAGIFLVEVGQREREAERVGCWRYGEKCYRLHLLPKRWGAAKYICSKKSKER